MAKPGTPVAEYQQLMNEIRKEKGNRWLADRIGTGESNISMLVRHGARTTPPLHARIVDFFEKRTRGEPTPPLKKNLPRYQADKESKRGKFKITRHFSHIPPVHLGRLRELAEKHGQVYLCERLGLTSSGVSRMLQRGKHGVRASTLAAVIDLVGKEGAEAPVKKPAKSNGEAALVSPPRTFRRVASPEGSTAAISAAFGAMSRLTAEERKRVLDALSIIEGA